MFVQVLSGSPGDGDRPVRSTVMQACQLALREGQAIFGEEFHRAETADRHTETADTMIIIAGTSTLEHGRMCRAVVSA